MIASLNVNTHAAETPVEVLTGQYLPLLLQTASAISADWAAYQSAPQVTVDRPAAPAAVGRITRSQAGRHFPDFRPANGHRMRIRA